MSRCRRAASARHHQAPAPGCQPLAVSPWLSAPGCLPWLSAPGCLPWLSAPGCLPWLSSLAVFPGCLPWLSSLAVFPEEERHTLLPWDEEPYEITHWRTVKVHPDHHVAGQYALYSVPSSLCPPGQRVEIGLASKLAPIYHKGWLLKLHPRQARGGRSTDAADYPTELTAYTLRAPEGIKRSAAEVGPAVAEFAERLFDGPLPWVPRPRLWPHH